MTNKDIRVPPQEVLDRLNLYYTYNPDTGLVIGRNTKPIGKKKNNGYIRITIGLTRIDGISRSFDTTAHQVAWYLTYGKWADMMLDHIDGDPTNNRISNLRLVTSTQNGQNRGKQKSKTTSKYKGVGSYPYDRWAARIAIDGKNTHIGMYATEEEAALAYNEKAKEVYGQFAKLNDVPMREIIRLPLSIGEANYNAKLTVEKVIEIRRLCAAGTLTHKAIGDMFGIKKTTVQAVIARRNWKHVP